MSTPYPQRFPAGDGPDAPIGTTAEGFAQLSGATFTGPVVLQPPTGPGEPSRITAYVPSTGRIARDGMEVGDTGWRAIATWDSSGTVTGAPLSASFAPRAGTPGGVHLTRRGNYSFVRITNLQAATTIAATDEAELFAAGLLPSVGFAETVTGWTSIQLRPGLIGVVRWPTVNGPFMLSPGFATSSGSVVAASVNNTSDPILANTAWPTTLPGAQITPPATIS